MSQSSVGRPDCVHWEPGKCDGRSKMLAAFCHCQWVVPQGPHLLLRHSGPCEPLLAGPAHFPSPAAAASRRRSRTAGGRGQASAAPWWPRGPFITSGEEQRRTQRVVRPRSAPPPPPILDSGAKTLTSELFHFSSLGLLGRRGKATPTSQRPDIKQHVLSAAGTGLSAGRSSPPRTANASSGAGKRRRECKEVLSQAPGLGPLGARPAFGKRAPKRPALPASPRRPPLTRRGFRLSSRFSFRSGGRGGAGNSARQLLLPGPAAAGVPSSESRCAHVGVREFRGSHVPGAWSPASPCSPRSVGVPKPSDPDPSSQRSLGGVSPSLHPDPSRRPPQILHLILLRYCDAKMTVVIMIMKTG
ncbi:GAS2-like protein 1 [Leopardus geoffroyi]|uniref:GAS2-like protein 1 n=1 Tax=Leopardus geoffroyi TaxID=46844 RepID=UPI001E25DBB7|nr:GAS2-like protein 1 [Leopardus geoffroyi]